MVSVLANLVLGLNLMTSATVVSMQSNPAVVSGLDVAIAGNQVTVSPGECRIHGAVVHIEQPTTLTVQAEEPVAIQDEKHVLSPDSPDKYARGTRLQGMIAGGTDLPGCLEPDSVVVKVPDGTVLEEGKDYYLDRYWAGLCLLEGSRATTETQVRISYRMGALRLDTIEITADGRVALIKGRSRKSAPPLPEISSGSLRLANIFRPYHAKVIEPWHVLPAGPAFEDPGREEVANRAALVPKTLAKLRSGQLVTIVTWGDSVTVGGDASSPEKRYANLFIASIKKRFPKAQITHINAGIGATNTVMRLPGLDADVLSRRPDLVTIEFVNDMGFSEELERRNYSQAIERIRAVGGEVIIITPHFTMPEMMQHTLPLGEETRHTVDVLRAIAAEKKTGLADTSRRWEHLEQEGIPYICYLENGINHPDDRGHELFVKDLLTFFPQD